jgi:DNA-binding transcriptional ArsR family regulator
MSDHGHPGRVLAALADDRRLRVLAALALGAESPADASARLGLPEREVERAIERLKDAGLVTDDLGVDVDAFRRAARDVGSMRAVVTPEDRGATPEQAAVLRNFWDDGRITALPMSGPKRRVVLDFLASLFEPGDVYPEAKVNDVLSRFHSDVATMRRYLVDEEFLERRDGFYWRAGGTFETE